MADILQFKTNNDEIQELCLKIMDSFMSSVAVCEEVDPDMENPGEAMTQDNPFTGEFIDYLVELVTIDPVFAEMYQTMYARIFEYIAERAQGGAGNTILN